MLIKGYGGSPQGNKVTIRDNIDIYSFVTMPASDFDATVSQNIYKFFLQKQTR